MCSIEIRVATSIRFTVRACTLEGWEPGPLVISGKHRSGPFSSQAASGRTGVALRTPREAESGPCRKDGVQAREPPENSAGPLPGASSALFHAAPQFQTEV